MGDLFGEIGNAIGYASSGAERGRASRFAGAALDAYKNLNPEINAVNVANPYADLANNPAAAAALGALGDLGAVSRGVGLTPQEASALQAAQLSNAQQQGAAVQAAMERAARGGTQNSGRALAGELGAVQGATNANAQAGAEAAANSAAQRQQAMGQVGQLGESLEGQQLQNQQFNSAQNVAAQEASAENAQRQAEGEQSAYNTLIGLNTHQQQAIQQLGQNVGNAAGQVASAAIPGTGGLSGLMQMFGQKAPGS